MKPLKTGYITIGSASDVTQWSGLNAHILSALRSAGLEVTVADKLGPATLWWPRLKAKLYNRWLKQTYALDRDKAIARKWSRVAAEKLAASEGVNSVVSTGTIPIAQLPASYRTAIWADATFHSLRTTYPGFERLCRSSVRSGEWLEQRAFDRASLICFSSQWAAADAANYYRLPDHKLDVIPYGANCPAAYDSKAEARAAIEARTRAQCRLVFVGVDWDRKGGPLVMATAQRLHDLGVPVHLTLAGCFPPADLPMPPWVECHGFLNKQVEADWRKWDRLMRAAHFLVVPSTAECYGLVYAEASAYAVPSMARNVGGVSSVVRQDKNGLLFSEEEKADAYANAISKLWREPENYQMLALSSYDEWRASLNWSAAGQQFVSRLCSVLASK